MTTENPLRDRALAFRSLHVQGSPLVLPNAWDIASARIVEDAGAAAAATNGAGLSWALGSADGDRLDRDRALAAVADIAAAVDVPVSADVESGYAQDATGVADTIRAVLAAGVSIGSGIAQAAHALVHRATRELLDAGTYGALAGGLDYGELNKLLPVR